MTDPVTTTVGLAALGQFLAGIPEHVGYHVVGGEAHHKFREFTERLGRRVIAGGLPANEHLEGALRNSLAGTALAFGYSLHDPDRRLFRDLWNEGPWTNFNRFTHQPFGACCATVA